MKKYLVPAKLICASLGLAILLLVVGTGAAYPSPLFQIGAPLGLGLVALAVVVMAADWALDMRDAIRQRQPLEILFLLIGAVLTVGLILFRR